MTLTTNSSSSNLAANTTHQSNLFDIFKSMDFNSKNKQYQLFELAEDVLALSIACKRLRSEGYNAYLRLTDRTLLEKVTDSDRALSTEIKNYYSKKLMLVSLMDESRMTPFRKDLASFILNESKVVKEEHLGMIYYLPNLYEYDINLDKVRSCVQSNSDWRVGHIKIFDENKFFSPIAKFEKTRRKYHTIQYWFKDSDNTAFMLEFEVGNPLLHMFDYMFDNVSKLEIRGDFFSKKFDNFAFLTTDKWKLVPA